ncbi:hypothetical protein H8959_007086, partial [Pygathrix nigripes]
MAPKFWKRLSLWDHLWCNVGRGRMFSREWVEGEKGKLDRKKGAEVRSSWEVGKPGESPGTRLIPKRLDAGGEPTPRLSRPRLPARPSVGLERAPSTDPNRVPGGVGGPPASEAEAKQPAQASRACPTLENLPRDQEPQPAQASGVGPFQPQRQIPGSVVGRRGSLWERGACAFVLKQERQESPTTKLWSSPGREAQKTGAASSRRVRGRSSQVCSCLDKLFDGSFSWLQPGFLVTGWRQEIWTSELLPEKIKCASPSEHWGGQAELQWERRGDAGVKG